MFEIELDEDSIVYTEGTSKGTQCKYYSEGYWYKTDNEGVEGLVEYLISRLLTFSDLSKEEYVLYEEGKINGKRGCRSKTFLGREESFVTLEHLHSNMRGQPLYETIRTMSFEQRIEYTLKFFLEITGLDLTDYFSKIFTIDYISLNEDRHFHNLGIIMDEKGNYRPAPIFDNGKSLLNTSPSRNEHFSLAENAERVTARPFSGSHEKMFQYFGRGFTLDVDGAISWLNEEEPQSFYRDLLIYQLERRSVDLKK